MLTLDDAVATARTGDIWLFRGKSLADRAIQTMTNSPVNHVGMVVALDDLQPLMWHAELGRSLPDVWTGERQRGVQLHILRDAVKTWAEKYGQQAWMRRLEGTITREHEDGLMQAIQQPERQAVPVHAGPDPLVGHRPRPAQRGHVGDRLLRRGRGLDLPADGAAAEQAPVELVRPGQVLERRPDRDGAAVRARAGDRDRRD